MKKGFYFWIMPKAAGSGKIRNIYISPLLGRLLLSISILVSGGVGFFVYHYIRYEMDRAVLTYLKEENKRAKLKIKEFEERTEFLGQKMKALFKEVNNLRIFANLEALPEDYLKMGKGGSYDSKADMEKVEAKLKDLLTLTDVQEKSLSKAIEYFKKEEELRDRTPSISPLSLGWITSRFGRRRDPFTKKVKFHEGIDISAPRGSPIFATADGVVKFAGWRSGYGYVVMIDHGYGFTTKYAHNAKVLVEVGDRVQRGDVIAYVGKTGRTTGVHVHYEVLLMGKPVNPESYIIPDTMYFD